MEFIFELLLEIIMEPIIEGYSFAITLFADKNKKNNKFKIQVFVVFECIALFVLFVIGGVMLLETNYESLVGKLLFLSSIVVSVVQILIGFILKKRKKKSLL